MAIDWGAVGEHLGEVAVPLLGGLLGGHRLGRGGKKKAMDALDLGFAQLRAELRQDLDTCRELHEACEQRERDLRRDVSRLEGQVMTLNSIMASLQLQPPRRPGEERRGRG